MFLTTRGLVLREVRYKESDKILTVLTQHEGKVTVRARGALRKGSRITAATQLLTYSDMTILKPRPPHAQRGVHGRGVSGPARRSRCVCARELFCRAP